ncbi:MAG: putative DNA binding domain-containing protein [Bacteroidota bacterium]|nr:putative DNA binding domain-containing protein [Bacteroidota bacterium]
MNTTNIIKSDFIRETLETIKISITTNQFIDVENSKIELKDLSTGGEWISLKETVCAYLNTDGGIIICGVRERNKQYNLSGFDRNNESKIIELQKSVFKNDNEVYIDLTRNIYFDYQLINLHNKNLDLLIIAVYPLSDDLKYISFNGKYYERKLTQDKEIPVSKISQQKEYKQELEFAKEIAPIDKATINDLNIDKINNYINLLNREIRSETLKSSLSIAIPFLNNQHFIRDNNVTLLGMLICGTDPFHYLASRVEVNAYYDTSSDIGKDKKIFRTDVLNLMEESFRYVWGKIKINRTISNGGKSEPEYPEILIRETINNALAHRDYSKDNFVTIKVEPNQYIEIKNPGSFKEKIKIVNTDTNIEVRRIIPGIPESKNPKLASILKVFDKIENQGRGMASLVNAALENKVDLAYYEIKDAMITLRIPTGKLVDDSIETWLNGFQTYIELKIKNTLTYEHKAVLAYFYKSELLNRKRFFTILLSESNNHFEVIDELKRNGILFEHQVSSEQTPIYVLDRVLLKTDFREELTGIMGESYIGLEQAAKEILNITYLFSKYKNQALKAAEITPEVYRRIYGGNIVGKTYETLGRRIRSISNQLCDEGILFKDTKSAYSFNFDYRKLNALF